MIRLTVLASGSSGNCALVESDGTRLLVDAGISARQIAERLAAIGVEPSTLDGVLITHEHSDHISGLAVLASRHALPVYTNRPTSEVLRLGRLGTHSAWRLFESGNAFQIGCLDIETFSVPHDAADPIGIVVREASNPSCAVGFLTDLGFATALVRERIRCVSTLLLEANHDEDLLARDTKRPWAVKQRILSRHGHLSNKAAADLVAESAGPGLRRIVLGHLSRDCNTPDLALSAMRERLAGCERAPIGELLCADPHTASPTFEV